MAAAATLAWAMPPIPRDDELRRFFLTSIPSVPYQEAMLLLRRESGLPWRSEGVAARLHFGEKIACGVMCESCSAEQIKCTAIRPNASWQRSRKTQDGSSSGSLTPLRPGPVKVIRLILPREKRCTQQFADAFKWRKDS